MADPLFVILVSGNPEGGDDGFARCAWLRVAELVAMFFRNREKTGAVVLADTVLRFIHFDCHTASVGIYEHDFAKQKGSVRDPRASSVQKDWKTLDAGFATEHGPLDAAKDPNTFVEWKAISDKKALGSTQALSIVDVYHSVRKAPAGSVLELSIFSHAFVDGPVLFNTSATTGLRRDPNDTDGRAAIDFQTDMGEDGAPNAHALDEFRNAFASTGSFRIWGCNIQDIVSTTSPTGVANTRCLIMSTVREVVDAAFTRQLRKGGTIAKLLSGSKLPPGSTSLTLDIDHEIDHEKELQSDPHAGHAFTPFSKDRLFEIRYVETFTNHDYQSFFRNERDTAGNFLKTLPRTLSEIVQFVASETIPSYFFVAAQALQTVTVVGGAPGTSAELDSLGQQTIGAGRLDQAKFFSKFFQISITDPDASVQRHYAFLDNKGDAVKSILDLKKHGLP